MNGRHDRARRTFATLEVEVEYTGYKPSRADVATVVSGLVAGAGVRCTNGTLRVTRVLEARDV